MSRRGDTTTALRPAERGITQYKHLNDRLKARTVTHWFTWRHIRCKVCVTPDYIQKGWTMLQLEIIAARDTPCPISTTGYLAYGIDADELDAAGGTVAFMTGWLNREAAKKAYQKAEFRWRQGDLLDQLTLEEDREA